MNIVKRIKNKRKLKKDIKQYRNGCKDTNEIRDEKEKHQEKMFRNELEKKDKTIEKLKSLLHKNDERNSELGKDILRLKTQLSEIESFVEVKQIKANTDAIRKLSAIQEAEKTTRRIEKKLPEIKKESEHSVVESNIEVNKVL